MSPSTGLGGGGGDCSYYVSWKKWNSFTFEGLIMDHRKRRSIERLYYFLKCYYFKQHKLQKLFVVKSVNEFDNGYQVLSKVARRCSKPAHGQIGWGFGKDYSVTLTQVTFVQARCCVHSHFPNSSIEANRSAAFRIYINCVFRTQFYGKLPMTTNVIRTLRAVPQSRKQLLSQRRQACNI
jgi:hypothetical protein